ncbi:ABC transporter permease [Cellulosilyticum sp. I15G10I2]|uniref:ABC transporter permease n=1 Tax=Cellulosilyticum sp. I15G10I2 TaxID=1892843 RepID=UPI00085CADAA|nr:ABC transporter permease [Cellulosilyticum sp. I15G10I2]
MYQFIEFLIKNQKMISQSLMVHTELVITAVFIGALIAIPAGIILSRYQKAAKLTLGFAGIIQTIPGLVMLGFALMLFGIGKMPAIVVLALYAILPILTNTYVGIAEVDKHYKEAAKGIGMTSMQILFKVEIPIALPTIVSGIKISTVYIVSWATLAALIGAGGLGDLIWTGLSTTNNYYIIAGAIPAAIMAVLIGSVIGGLQRLVTPRGLKVRGGK